MTEASDLAKYASKANAVFNSVTANSTAITAISVGGTSINATSFPGTANNTSFVGSVSAANVVSNAQLSANLANYQTTTGLSANVATLAANSSTYANASVTNTFTVGTAAYFVANGNVGIGTNTPVYKLDVYSASGDSIIASRSAASGAGIFRAVGANTTFAAYNALISTEFGGTQQWYLGGDGVANTIVMKTGTTEAMRIAANGNIGIGTSSPGQKFAVIGTSGDVATFGGTGGSVSASLYGSNGDNRYQSITYGPSSTARYPGYNIIHYTSNATGGDSGGYPVLEMYRLGGNSSITFATPTGTVLSGLNTSGSNSTSSLSATRIETISEAAFTTTATAAIRLLTTNAGTQAERMRVAANGNVGIANTAPVNKLHVTGDASISTSLYLGATTTVGSTAQLSMQGYNAGGGTGYHQLFAFYNTYGTATNPYKYVRLNSAGGIEVINSAYNAVIFTMDNSGNFTAAANITAYSDIRLKANIHPIQDALAKVQQMQGVSYERKSDGEKKIGFIAQDLQKVLPEVVIENHDGLLSVDYGNIVALLTEAIKEQQQQIEDMKLEIKELKNGNFRTT